MRGIDFSQLLKDIALEVTADLSSGEVAQYIPELAGINPNQFGMAIATVTGDFYVTGDADVRFSIQSISKLFALVLALQLEGEGLWSRVGRDPSGTPFNSLVQLEHEQGRPRNPFINAGALVVTDILCQRYAIPENAVAELLGRLIGRPPPDYNTLVARSERLHSDRNAAMAHLIRSFGNLRCSVATVLDAYCQQCAIEMSCYELASAMLFLANGGAIPRSGDSILDAQTTKRLNSLLLTCGTYDAAGEVAFRVGLPAKSGVGGGIVAVAPGDYAVCVWSPRLDHTGNSHAGIRALELLTTKTAHSIF